MSTIPVPQSISTRVLMALNDFKEKIRLESLTDTPCPYCGCFFLVVEKIHDHCSYVECSRLCEQCARDRADEFYEAMSKGGE